MVPRRDEHTDIPVQKTQRLPRQDYVLTVDLVQPMHFDSAATAGIVVIVLQRYHPPPVRASSADATFQIPEQLLRELRASLAHGYSDFDVHTADLSETHGRSEQDHERQLVLT